MTFPPPSDLFASRFPTIREDSDADEMGCCEVPWVSPHHAPNCPERCEHCGSEGGDNDHRAGCPTIGTCGQCDPTTPPPWHPDKEWLTGETFTAERWREHMRTAHPDHRRRYRL